MQTAKERLIGNELANYGLPVARPKVQEANLMASRPPLESFMRQCPHILDTRLPHFQHVFRMQIR